MSIANPTIFVTGANGQLGRLVVNDLLSSVPAQRIIAGVRNPATADKLSALGVAICGIDYERPETLDAAITGVERLLLISSSEVGKRAKQHQNVIDAAARAHIVLIVYTSILHADTTPIDLAAEHRVTEAALAASGIPFVLLRNGWYMENYLASAATAVQYGTIVGCSGNGRIAAAARADYAAAAAAVLTSPDDRAAQVYELAGDDAFTKAQLATAIATQSGKPVEYKNVSEAEYADILAGFGLDAAHAATIAQSDAVSAGGALFDNGHALSTLIGRPTVALADAVAAALAGQPV